MREALVALHFQNDVCHPDGRIPFALDRASGAADVFLARCRNVMEEARGQGWLVVHVHIAFADDYADLPRNCRLFRAVEERGAVKRGSWGAAPFSGFEPRGSDVVLEHQRNSALGGTVLEALLREANVERVSVMGLATQFSVEHTARDAADLGYQVRVIGDCCASADAAAHDASLRTLAMLAEVVATSDLVE